MVVSNVTRSSEGEFSGASNSNMPESSDSAPHPSQQLHPMPMLEEPVEQEHQAEPMEQQHEAEPVEQEHQAEEREEPAQAQTTVIVPHVVSYENGVMYIRPGRVSTLVIEVARCKQVFTGKLELPFCSANVMAHLVAGNLDPERCLPPKSLQLDSCVTTGMISLPEKGKVYKYSQFAIIVFISRYKKWYMLDPSWAEFRDVLFAMPPTPCTFQLLEDTWGHCLRPGDSGISQLSQFNPALFGHLEGMPCLYMVLFKKRVKGSNRRNRRN